MPDVTAGALRRGPGGLEVLSYAKDHTSALFQQAKEREERLREERASRRDQEAAPNVNAQPAKPGMSVVRLVKRKGVGVAEPGKKAKLQVVLEDQFKDDEDDEEEGLGGLLGDYDSDDDAEEEEPAKQQQKEDKEEKNEDKPKVKLPAPSELGVLDLPDWTDEVHLGKVEEQKVSAKPVSKARAVCNDFLRGRCDRGKRCKFAHDVS